MQTKLEVALSRRRWRAVDAEIVLSALARSDCTVTEFARRHGLRRNRLQQWVDRQSPASMRSESPSEPVDVPLLPVRVVGASATESLSQSSTFVAGAALDVSVGRGVIRVPHDFDEVHLGRVVGVLVATC